mmetsp:Transcript_56908/g.144315  ORF Transcript_56908/g.144315 Transcript_56908/m.144315 type:complete len:181 (+) Transcript_56908:62-604(+)
MACPRTVCLVGCASSVAELKAHLDERFWRARVLALGPIAAAPAAADGGNMGDWMLSERIDYAAECAAACGAVLDMVILDATTPSCLGGGAFDDACDAFKQQSMILAEEVVALVDASEGGVFSIAADLQCADRVVVSGSRSMSTEATISLMNDIREQNRDALVVLVEHISTIWDMPYLSAL